MELAINPDTDLLEIGRLWRENRVALPGSASPATDAKPVADTEFVYLALEKVGMGVAFLYDTTLSKVVYMSESIESITGFPRQDFMHVDTRRLFERTTDPTERTKLLVHGQLMFFTLAALPYERKLGYKSTVVFRFRTQAGKWIWIHVQVAPRRLDKFGNPLEMMGLAIPQPEGMQMQFYASQSVLDASGQPQPLGTLPKLLANAPAIRFTPQEMKVLRHIAQGFTSREIADLLTLSQHTVDEYRSRMLKKSNSTNSAELISYSLLNGLL